MKVSYSENKAGRYVTSLTFIVEDLEHRVYEFNKDKSIKGQMSIDEVALDLSKSDNSEVLLTSKKETLDITEECLKMAGINIEGSIFEWNT